MVGKEVVLAYIDSHQNAVIDLLNSLISFDSINPGDGINGNEKAVQSFIIDLMKKSKLDVHVHAYDKDKNRPNVVSILKGSGNGRSLILNGHTDVVPITFPEHWHSNPFKGEIRDGKLYGRGASDMKGGLAAAISAVLAIQKCCVPLKGDVLVETVVGEESQSAETFGTDILTKSEGYTADFAISCEPSAMEIQVASPGLVFFKLTVEGKSVHTSARNQALYPQPYGIPCGAEIAVDAFEKSLPLVDYIRRFELQINQRYRSAVLGGGGIGGHDKQGVGTFTLNPSHIEGGEYLGTVPGKMEYTYCVWFPDKLVSKEALMEELKAGILAIAKTDDWLKDHLPKFEYPVIQDWAGFSCPVDNPGVEVMKGAVEKATGKSAIISSFKAVCDGTYLEKAGIPTIVYGPGALFNAVHADNEFVVVDDLIEATKTYAQFIMDWCN